MHSPSRVPPAVSPVRRPRGDQFPEAMHHRALRFGYDPSDLVVGATMVYLDPGSYI